MRERTRRFTNFVADNVQLFAGRANRGFSQVGRGAVVINVAEMHGGERYWPQHNLHLSYISQAAIGRMSPVDPGMVKHVSEYDPERQAFVLATYSSGLHDGAIVNVADILEERGEGAGG
jgi:hypothetical protein